MLQLGSIETPVNSRIRVLDSTVLPSMDISSFIVWLRPCWSSMVVFWYSKYGLKVLWASLKATTVPKILTLDIRCEYMFPCLYFNGSKNPWKLICFLLKLLIIPGKTNKGLIPFTFPSASPQGFLNRCRDTFPKSEKIFTGALTSILGGAYRRSHASENMSVSVMTLGSLVAQWLPNFRRLGWSIRPSPPINTNSWKKEIPKARKTNIATLKNDGYRRLISFGKLSGGPWPGP